MYWSLGGSVSGGGLQQTAGGDKVKGQEEEDAAALQKFLTKESQE